MEIPKELLAAYFNTDYLIPELGLCLSINESNRKLQNYLIKQGFNSFAFITAWNPNSELQSLTTNQAANQKLKLHLRAKGFSFFDGLGQGRDGNWPAEESFLVMDIDLAEAFQVAVAFRQMAFLWGNGQAIPRLYFSNDKSHFSH